MPNYRTLGEEIIETYLLYTPTDLNDSWRWNSRYYGYAMRCLNGNPDDASDALQDAAIALYERFKEHPAGTTGIVDNPRAYASKAIRHAVWAKSGESLRCNRTVKPVPETSDVVEDPDLFNPFGTLERNIRSTELIENFVASKPEVRQKVEQMSRTGTVQWHLDCIDHFMMNALDLPGSMSHQEAANIFSEKYNCVITEQSVRNYCSQIKEYFSECLRAAGWLD